MTQVQQKLIGEPRSHKAGLARQQGKIPAALYGHDMSTMPVQVDYKLFIQAWKEAGHASLVNLHLGDDTYPVVIREVQTHPVKGHILHVDFYRVRLDEEITTKVPVVLSGVAPAVKNLGGVLVRNLDEIELKALPQDVPHEITVDISFLDSFEKNIYIRDLKLPSGVECLEEADAVVVLVQEPRTEAELEELSAEVKEDVEAVEGVKEEAPVEEETAETASDDKKTKDQG